jgi:predicted nuclease with TOPRIM domain
VKPLTDLVAKATQVLNQLADEWGTYRLERPEIKQLRVEAMVLKERANRLEQAASKIREKRLSDERALERECEKEARMRIKHLQSVKDLLRDVGIDD